MSSNAVGNERVSKIVGYKITKGDFSNQTPNLPARIVIIGEANTANQSGLDTDGVIASSLKQVGDDFGYGSPIYMAYRILKPVQSDGVGGIPVVIFAQEEPDGADEEIQTVTVTGTATGNGTHTIVICGRNGIDGESYDFNVSDGDTATNVAAKINTVINNVLGAPVTSTVLAGVVTATSKWKGATASEIVISVNNNGNALGMSYAVLSTQSGDGAPTVTSSLEKFENDWNNIVLNTYGVANTDILDELEAFNGIPDPSTPTGRYAGIIWKPFIAVTGSVAQENTTLTNARKNDVTIAIAPAPTSKGLPLEAAANMTLLLAKVMQETPHLDVSGFYYPDMPPATGPVNMTDYDLRDQYVKKGNSTVDVIGGKFKVMDFVTTYHPVGENVPQYRYVRSLIIDFNVKFGYYLKEEINVVDHAIASDDDVVNVPKVVKPKQWKAIINNYADELSNRGLITEPSFMQNSITVGLSSSNPDRLETFFRYKRSGFVRIASTTAEAGFNFGN